MNKTHIHRKEYGGYQREEGWYDKEWRGWYMVIKEDLMLGGEHTMHCADDVWQNRALETYIILWTNVTPIHLIKNKEDKMKF